MRNRAVLAGVVAIVAAACGGAAMDGVGDAMRDAGELLNNAGDAMVDAGNAIAGSIAHAAGGEGGGAAGEAGGAGSSSGAGGGTAPAETALPNPRWVLRDKDGVPVQALLSDQTYQAGKARPRFTDSVGECVTIDRLGQRDIRLSYSLSTGKLDGCGTYSELSDWRTLPSLATFATDTCDGVAVTSINNGVTVHVGGTHYYVNGAPTHITTIYRWSGSACVAMTTPDGWDMWSWKPIPADVANALPNPPYSLSVAY